MMAISTKKYQAYVVVKNCDISAIPRKKNCWPLEGLQREGMIKEIGLFYSLWRHPYIFSDAQGL
jgi:hypothetical protein